MTGNELKPDDVRLFTSSYIDVLKAQEIRKAKEETITNPSQDDVPDNLINKGLIRVVCQYSRVGGIGGSFKDVEDEMMKASAIKKVTHIFNIRYEAFARENIPGEIVLYGDAHGPREFR